MANIVTRPSRAHRQQALEILKQEYRYHVHYLASRLVLRAAEGAYGADCHPEAFFTDLDQMVQDLIEEGEAAHLAFLMHPEGESGFRLLRLDLLARLRELGLDPEVQATLEPTSWEGATPADWGTPLGGQPYAVRTLCQYELEVAAPGPREAVRQAEDVPYTEWKQTWGAPEAEPLEVE